MDVSLGDLIIAYRKAKNDAFYENGHLSAEDFVFYESKLEENLIKLQQALKAKDFAWITSIEFTGKHSFLPKGITIDHNTFTESDTHIYRSNSVKVFESAKFNSAQFRLIGFRHSVHFHVICSLWVDKVGYKLETLLSKNAYGCRLRKPKNSANPKAVSEENGVADLPSHFRKYIFDYKRWQKTALLKAQKSLENGDSIAILTTDIQKFYHRIDPSFLLKEGFLSLLGNNPLSRLDRELTEILILVYGAWSDHIIASKANWIEKYTTSENGKKHVGIPIALSASKVIANLYLTQFDRDVENNVEPIFYGRYVDDIILILKNNDNINSHDDFWTMLRDRFKGISHVDESKKLHRYTLDYSPFWSAELIFPIDKEKLFLLEPGNGELFLETVKEAMDESSSEWRMMPDPENDLSNLERKIVGANSDVTEKVSGFRKANGISVKRMGFSIELRNMEVLIQLLDKSTVKPYLNKFFQIVNSQIVSPEGIFTYFHYYPRLLALTVSSENLELASSFIKRLNNSFEILDEVCEDHELRLMRKYCWQLIKESVFKSLNPYSSNIETFVTDLERELTKSSGRNDNQTFKSLQAKAEAFITYDLHNVPLKFWILDDSNFTIKLLSSWKSEKPRGSSDAYRLRQRAYLSGELLKFVKLSSNLKQFTSLIWEQLNNRLDNVNFQVPSSFFFYTRPFNYLDITSYCPNWPYRTDFDFQQTFGRLYYPEAIPHYSPNAAEKGVHEYNDSDRLHPIKLANYNFDHEPVIAVVNIETKDESWLADVKQRIDPDGKRVIRIFQLISGIMGCGEKIDYIVFPELSIPHDLLRYIAGKLTVQGISIIAGVTYKHFPVTTPRVGETGYVKNELVYLLYQRVNGFGMHLQIRQNKSEAAIHEESELWRVGGRIMITDNVKYLIKDRGFLFSGLICNELLSINYRHQLLGEIDALIIVEWNKDLETYDPIVSATANDLHCYVIQVNNRKYGDTRVRAPYKDAWRRDIARVRGGILDYFVVVRLEINSLREFQSHHRSPDKPFKPTPTGYKMSSDREHLRLKTKRQNE
ncbi:MAG: RNA-directed DNA polymerase [Bacteroidota bacterium]